MLTKRGHALVGHGWLVVVIVVVTMQPKQWIFGNNNVTAFGSGSYLL